MGIGIGGNGKKTVIPHTSSKQVAGDKNEFKSQLK